MALLGLIINWWNQTHILITKIRLGGDKHRGEYRVIHKNARRINVPPVSRIWEGFLEEVRLRNG